MSGWVYVDEKLGGNDKQQIDEWMEGNELKKSIKI